jgi:hypothetical protein
MVVRTAPKAVCRNSDNTSIGGVVAGILVGTDWPSGAHSYAWRSTNTRRVDGGTLTLEISQPTIGGKGSAPLPGQF